MARIVVFFLLAVLGLTVAPTATLGQIRYTITDLGNFDDRPAGGFFVAGGSSAAAINNAGQIVGSATKLVNGSYVNRAFLWDAVNGMQDLGTLGFNTATATGINILGQVCGTLATGSTKRPFFWSPGGGMQDLGSLPDGLGNVGEAASAAGINDLGQVAVTSDFYSADPYQHPQHAAVWNAVNGLRSLADKLPPTSNYHVSSAVAINNQGKIAGTGPGLGVGGLPGSGPGGFLLTPKTGNDYDYTNLGWLGTGTTTQWFTIVQGMNNLGDVVGASCDTPTTSSRLKAYLWSQSTQTMTNLGRTTDFGEYDFGTSQDINDKGEIIGQLQNYNGTPARFNDVNTAVIWDAKLGRWTRLQTLIDTTLGWQLEDAVAINEAGQIVGVGINPQGMYHAYLLTPVPEPSTLALALIGVVGLLAGTSPSLRKRLCRYIRP